MSSLTVRTTINTFLTTNFPTETIIDLSGDYLDMEDLIAEAGITRDDPWIGLQFSGNEEIPVDILATNDAGTYRESGSIFIHVVDIAKSGVQNAILSRVELIRNKLRGQRIGSLVIEAVSPANFGNGVSLSFEGGYTSATINIDYHLDINL